MSLRWRLPLLTCALVVGVLGAAVWLAYREVETTLVGAAGERAQASADQIAGLLERSLQQVAEILRRAARDPAVVRHFQTHGQSEPEPVRRAFGPLTTAGPRRIELWHRDGSRLADIEVPAPADGGAPAPALPAGTPPTSAARGGIQALNGLAFSDEVVEVRAGPGDDGTSEPLGYIRVRSTTRENPPGIMRRILGGTAGIKVGSVDGTVWTDLTRMTSPPRIDATRRGIAQYRSDNGVSYVGALALVRGTPFVAWVEFDRAAVVAPAREFLRRMIPLALAVVAVAFIVVATVSARLTKPLHELAHAADTIADGDFSAQVRTHRHDEIGRLAGAFNQMAAQVGADLDARERAEEALRAREASFRALFSDNPLPMWVYDAETLRFLEVNDAAVGHYGYSRDEFLTMTIKDIRPHEDVPRLLAAIAEEGDGYQRAGAWRHRLKAGQAIDVEIVSHTTVFQERAASLVVVQDVTERRQLEERLRQSQKMDAIGQLAGGVAHDFNNLLTAITGYSSLLLEQLPAGDPMRLDIEQIRKAAETAASLTSQLLAFSRRQILKPEILDLNAVVARMHALLDRLIGEDIDLDTRLSPGLGKVNADPGQIEQIILNLSLNARDAMPTGGRLTLETATVVLDEAYAAHHVASSPGAHVMLAVSDTGVGMDAETRARIFEPFFTTKHHGKGTGLGLATVYGIVKQSGGSIWVYSEPGRGATFKVYLPIAAEPAAAAVTQPRPSTLGGSETILVAEDQAEVRNVVRTVLSRHGYTVLEAEDGDAALRLLREHPSPIHLLLTDVVMPSMSGRELAAQLRASHPSIKVLYTSGYTDDAIVRHGVLEPGVAFIQKPFAPKALLEKIREVLDAG